MAYYLVSNVINGESADAQYKDSVELLTFDQGVKQSKSSTTSSSSSSTSRAEFREIKVTKHVDKSSPQFYQACASGQPLGDISIYFVRADASGPITYLTAKLGGSIIASVDTGGYHENIPIDVIEIRFNKILWKYDQQGLSGGSIGSIQGAWSLTQNIPTFA